MKLRRVGSSKNGGDNVYRKWPLERLRCVDAWEIGCYNGNGSGSCHMDFDISSVKTLGSATIK
jgi:hypothetical protein